MCPSRLRITLIRRRMGWSGIGAGVPDRDQRVAAMHKSLIRPHGYAGPHVAARAASQFDAKAGPVLPFPGILPTRHPTPDIQIGLNRSLGSVTARTVPDVGGNFN